MSRSAKYLIAAFVAGAAVVATAGPANAQYGYFYRQQPTIYSYYAFGPVVMPFGYGIMPAYGLGMNRSGAFFPSPTGGYGFMSSRLYYSPMYYPSYGGGGGYSPSYPTSGSYGYGMAARESYYLRQAQQGAAGYGAAGGLVNYDRVAPDRGAKAADPKVLWKNSPEAFRHALLNPTDQEIATGQALNVLLRAIPDLESAGAKADPPFLPPDFLAKVTFAGGPSADALNLVRTGTVEFPPVLRGSEFDGPRAAVEKDLAAAAEQVRNGKKVDTFLFDRIGENVKRMKAKPEADDDAAAAVLARLERVVKFLKTPDANGLFVPAWQTDGVTLRDLSKFMARFKLEFGPAAAGGEPVYAALHRGTAAYVNQLAQAKR